jgi:molybdopterin-biosynthesis enzyme MoeA-like protein
VTQTQEATINELQASAEKQAQQTQDLAAKLAAAETSNRKIASMLAQTDIVKNSLVDPTGVEVRINEEVDLFFNELQSLTSD